MRLTLDLVEILYNVAQRPFDQKEYTQHDWRVYQFLSDLGLVAIRYGFMTITPLGCLFLKNHTL